MATAYKHRVPRQRWLRVIPVALIMYTIAYVDRTNISMALPSISRDLAMDSVQAGNVAGIFFWGYLLLQVPAGYLANRWSAKRLISVLLVIWGVCAIGCGLAESYQQIRLMRFLLGMAESGVYPATLVLISHWFPRQERALANALWIICLPLAVVVSSPLSGWILDRWNWRTMMIIEGLCPLVWLFVWQIVIHDYPCDAPWLSRSERDYLEKNLTSDAIELAVQSPDSSFRALVSPQVLLLSVICFCRNAADFGFLVWFPTILADMKRFNNTAIGGLVAVPFIVGIVSMVIASWHSDKYGERRMHMALTFAIGGFALLLGLLVSRYSLAASYTFFCLAGVGTYAYLGPFWSIPTETLSKNIVGPAIGFINGNANLGAFVGSIAVGVIRKYTGGFVYGFAMLAVALLLASGLCFCLKPASLSRAQ